MARLRGPLGGTFRSRAAGRCGLAAAAAVLLGLASAGQAAAQGTPQGGTPQGGTPQGGAPQGGAPQSPPTGGPPGQHPPTMNMDRMIRTFLLTEVLEMAPGVAGRPITLDGTGWIGGDYNRVFLSLEADQPTTERGNDLAADVSYGRLVSPFWSALAGVRVESRLAEPGRRRTRALLALGFEGLAPGFFTLEPAVYVSPRGEISGQVSSTFDLLFTQRLILQPRVEVNAAVQKVPEFQIGAGVNDVEVGGRLRYEFRRDLAPYVGVVWTRRTGGTAVMARQAGESVGDFGLVAGVRVWR